MHMSNLVNPIICPIFKIQYVSKQLHSKKVQVSSYIKKIEQVNDYILKKVQVSNYIRK